MKIKRIGEIAATRFLFLTLVAFLILSCSVFKNKEETFDVVDEEDEKNMIETLEQFFVLNQDGYMYYEDGNIINALYEKQYTTQYPDYYSFKIAVLNNDVNPPLPKGMARDGVIFDTEYRFLVDSVVMADYRNCSLEEFIEKYCYIGEHARLMFIDDYPDTQCTVAYCLWLTGKYFFEKDGFAGGAYIEEDSTLNALCNLRHQNEEKARMETARDIK